MGLDSLPPTLANVFVPKSNDCNNKPAVRTVTAVSESPDLTGLIFDWEAPSPATITQVSATWAELSDLPVPEDADVHVARLVHQRAKGFWELVLDRYEQDIRCGDVQLLARKGSPFSEPEPVPKAAAPFIQVVDWLNGTVEVAGDMLFEVRVIPPVDPKAAYAEAVRNAGASRRGVELIIRELFPMGLSGRPKPPAKPEPPDHVVLTMISDEYKRFGMAPPSDTTILRAAHRKD